ncbi:peptide chain release factor H [Flavobacterium piscis]|jgi:peptide chain release factor|uniref:Peptide chain release factor H n=1 Tax=Flavobacterium piscis TaxID=1114874 RepID=A0ABX2XHF2_9FLAO|nr:MULTISPECIES: peptide chain release factor H [Flavobacterium]MCA1919935.1 peptide chain release factor H [Flavobacterium piscis]OCB73270.1 peptide chain release factor H [Flavobacterium piscis]OXG05787.1 peptide chain release factor H [Flavobacterium piscis]QDW21279.1 peptide chain release factor H [Flavobacterium sp. KBS0721]
MEKIIQITAGRGPAECTWVVAQVLKKVLDEAQEQGLEATLLQREVGQENGTVETATIAVKGKDAVAFADSWIGTIQWIGQSQFRKMHKRKNWFIGIFEIEPRKKASVSENDIQYQAMRSSGAGGQHVNKVSSAIRATHIPTGIAVVSMDSRSQHQNKKLATERLLKKLEEETLQQLKNHVGKQWENQLNIQRGNPVRIFTGSDFKKNKEEKSYKGIRQQLKTDLRNENN